MMWIVRFVRGLRDSLISFLTRTVLRDIVTAAATKLACELSAADHARMRAAIAPLATIPIWPHELDGNVVFYRNVLTARGNQAGAVKYVITAGDIRRAASAFGFVLTNPEMQPARDKEN